MDTTTAFDPTSSANVTASAILFLGLMSIVTASFTMGRFKRRYAYQFNASIAAIFSALTVIAAAMYIFFAYD